MLVIVSITDVNGTPNASEAPIAFGFGDIISPDLPPPIIASKIAILEIPFSPNGYPLLLLLCFYCKRFPNCFHWIG